MLVGLGFSETYTPWLVPAAASPTARAARADRRPGGPAADAPPRSARGGCAERLVSGTSASRSSRSPSLPADGDELPEEQLHVAASPRAASPGQGRRRGALPALEASSASSGQAVPLRAARRASTRARSGSSTRACSREPGAASSSTSTRCSLPTRAGAVRGRDRVSGGQAGPRVRRRRGGPRGRPDRSAREAAGPELREMRVFDVYGALRWARARSRSRSRPLPVAGADALG